MCEIVEGCAWNSAHNRAAHVTHLELLEVGAAFLPGGSHDVEEVWRENEGDPLLADSHETLVVPQDVAEVDVEEVSWRNTKDGCVSFVCAHVPTGLTEPWSHKTHRKLRYH